MISVDLRDFRWRVADAGHQVVTTREPGSETASGYLTDGIPLGSTGYHFAQPLLDHSGLFREFAAIALDEGPIRAFADRNGMLTEGRLIEAPHVGKDGHGRLLGSGESVFLWHSEILEMRRCVDLLEMARRKDVDALKRHIHWTEDGVTYVSMPEAFSDPDFKPGPGFCVSKIASRSGKPALFDLIRPGDVVVPAYWYVQSAINKRISEHSGPRMLWDTGNHRLINHVMPKNLLGSLWLQFAIAVERGSEFRQCAHCGKWFEVSPKAARSDKQFCSTGCRVKAFRLRKLNQEPVGSAIGTRIPAPSVASRPPKSAPRSVPLGKKT